jgi:protein-L-isoaspartate(D-aspartate) O-methyltransferase
MKKESFMRDGKRDNSTMSALRNKMVDRQIVSRGIRDKGVIEAMRTVPRHEFVPQHSAQAAYEDHPLPVGEGQTISQPYIVALMTELCRLTGTERVLEVGTGSGYQAAILAHLAEEVYSLEIVESLYKKALQKLDELGHTNIHMVLGNGFRGLPDKAPFDAILLTAAPPKIPKPLIRQLKDNGGRLVAPVGTFSQELVVLTKENGEVNTEHVTYVQFVPMVNGRKKE